MPGMGRHTATDGSSVHPLVAEGMARRGSATGSHRTAENQDAQAGEVGWPAPPNKGHGLGWPGDLSADDEEPQPSARRGWRRLFGRSPAA
jgi:hypothetical protein